MKYIRLFVLFFFSILLPNFSYAQQPFDWIGSSFYYKMEVRETGFYQVTHTEVSSVVNSLASVKLSELQVFHRGQEVAIHVHDQNKNDRFDSEDYFEFYAVKNDGLFDDELYSGHENRMNTYESLYSHSSFYFFTFNNSGVLGKRIQTAPIASNSANTQTELASKRLISYRAKYFKGRNIIDNSSIYASKFLRGAGFADNEIRDSRKDYTIKLDRYKPNTPISLEMKLLSIDKNKSNSYKIYVGKDANTLVQMEEHTLFDVTTKKSILTINSSEINSDSSFVIRLETTLNAIALSYCNITYTSVNALENHTQVSFTSSSNTQSHVVEISDLNNDHSAWDVSDRYNIKRISLINGTQLSWEAENNDADVYICSEKKSIFSIKRTEWNINTNPSRFNFLLIYHQSLKGAGGDFSDVIEAYKDYRESEDGGSYEVELKEIEEIYDLFTYGEITPLAIRKYVNFMYEEGKDKYLFLVGQGLEVAADYYNKQYNLPKDRFQCFIPTYGTNSSDNLLAAPLGDDTTPLMGVGRLSCWTPTQVANYLEKVDKHELISMTQIWKKNILHVRGGSSRNDANRMDIVMNTLHDQATKAYLGGVVDNEMRETFDDYVAYVNISKQVNEGRTMVTYLGHSSTSHLDMDIGYVSQDKYGFDNLSRYPLTFVNGCNAGNIFTKDRITFSTNENAYKWSWAEDWTFTAEKGSILFLGMASTGEINDLESYMEHFYEYQFNIKSMINQTIGKIIMEMNKANFRANDESYVAHLQQYILNGDPAVKLFNTEETFPDFSVTENIELQPLTTVDRVSATDDAFIVRVPIQNLGFTYDHQDVDIQLIRKFPDNSRTTYVGKLGDENFYLDNHIDSLNNTSVLNIYVRNSNEQKTKGAGINNFTVNINYTAQVKEHSMLNNSISTDLLISDGLPVFITPFNEQIITQEQLNILIQNVGYLGDDHIEYTFTLDDSYTFQTPILTEKVIGGTYANLTIPKGSLENKVYYLKAQYIQENDTLESTINFKWDSHLQNGWGQFSQYQFTNTHTVAVNMRNEETASPQDSPEWFFPNEKQIYARSSRFYNDKNYEYDFELSVDGLTYINVIGPDKTCRHSSWHKNHFLTVYIDHNNGEFYQANPGWTTNFDYCGLKTNHSAYGGNIYVSVPLEPKQLSEIFVGPTTDYPPYTEDYKPYSAKPGDHVILLAQGNIDYANLQEDDVKALDSLGIDAESFIAMPQGAPYIAFARNNNNFDFDPNYQATEIKPENASIDVIESTQTIRLDITEGEIITNIIGPALEGNGWKNATIAINASNSDINKLYIYGFTQNETERLILETTLNDGLNTIDLSSISSSTYPYLQLKWISSDIDERTPSHLSSWNVAFDEAPDGSLNYKNKSDENYIEGEIATAEFSFYNTGNVNFTTDSLWVYFTINGELDQQIKIESPVVGDSTVFKWERSTENLQELNELTVRVNPDNQETTVVEKTYINNTLPYFFEVELDTYSPYTDVFFDGKRIMNGEIVSPNAIVNVLIKDDNEHLPMTEVPEEMKVFLGRTNVNDLGNITNGYLKEDFTFENNAIEYADFNSNEKDELSVLYDLTDLNLETGIYALMIQNVEDRAGNEATDPDNNLRPEEKEHIVIFEINTEKTVTQVYPYPNPFSDKVRFVFTITGTEAPTQMKIQIMTVTGKVVREITQDELGPIRIGDNISEYAWDGKDEFGDQLANGVYLYRVIWGDGFDGFKTKSNDQLFKNNIGKMYLLR